MLKVGRIDENQKLRKLDPVLEYLILFLTGLYLADQAVCLTMFPDRLPTVCKIGLLLALSIVALIRWYIHLSVRWFAISLAVTLIYFADYLNNRYNFLLFLAVLTIALAGISYRKILLTYMISSAAVTASAILASYSGVIDNLVYSADGRIRSSWGIAYPTDLASVLLFILFVLWILSGRRGSIILLPVTCLYIIFCGYIPSSRNGVFIGVLFVLVLVLDIIGARLIPGSSTSPIRRFGNCFMQIMFPICALIMLLLAWCYHKGYAFAAIIDDLTNMRLTYGALAYELHGIHMFGSPFEQTGFGGSLILDPYYFFVDSSYLLIFIRYGWAVFILIMILWVYGTGRAIRAGNRRVACVMALICIHSLLEHHFTEINLNIFLVMPFAAYEPCTDEKTSVGEGERTGFLMHCVAGIIMTAISVIVFPCVISIIRTGVTLRNIRDNTALIILFVALELVFIGAWIWLYKMICHIGDGLLSGTKDPGTVRKNVTGAVCAAVVLVMPIVVSLAVIQRAVHEGVDIAEEEKKPLAVAASASWGRIYAEDKPEIYKRCVSGISDSFLLGEDLARCRDVTIIRPDQGESNALMTNGFSYLQLSDDHALYSNDHKVIAALTDAGYPVTDYYSREFSADMEELAQLNGLETDPEGGLILHGSDHALLHGPYVDLFAGKYRVTWKLRLLPAEGQARDGQKPERRRKVCAALVKTFRGQYTIRKMPVFADEFDDDGKLVLDRVYSDVAAGGVEYLIVPEESVDLVVESVSWRKVP